MALGTSIRKLRLDMAMANARFGSMRMERNWKGQKDLAHREHTVYWDERVRATESKRQRMKTVHAL